MILLNKLLKAEIWLTGAGNKSHFKDVICFLSIINFINRTTRMLNASEVAETTVIKLWSTLLATTSILQNQTIVCIKHDRN